jgi:hypothetical protein
MEFSELLKRLIKAKFKSQRAFIRAAEPLANEDSAQGYVSRVLSGTKPPPLNRIGAWADALGLSGEARQQFLDLALEDVLHRTPEEVQRLVASLRAELARAGRARSPKS